MRPDENPWLKHGPQGFLVRRLARHALTGWLLFAASGLALTIESLAAVLKSPAIVVASPNGRILGRIRWEGHGVRSNRQMVRAAVRFTRDYLSVNSGTIVHDYASALGMMSGRLLARTVKALRATHYLARVRLDRTRSWLTLGRGPQMPHLAAWSGHTALVRVQGVLHVILANGHEIHEAFGVLLRLVPARRTVRNASGACVTAIRFIRA